MTSTLAVISHICETHSTGDFFADCDCVTPQTCDVVGCWNKVDHTEKLMVTT